MILASTSPRSADPAPWKTAHGPRGNSKALADRLGIPVTYEPRPEFGDLPRAHPGNPTLVAFRSEVRRRGDFEAVLDDFRRGLSRGNSADSPALIHARAVLRRLPLAYPKETP